MGCVGGYLPCFEEGVSMLLLLYLKKAYGF
jgi:hypothetical protein